MSPDDYILDIKERFGTQRNKEGVLIRDMNDKELLKRMLQRYPGDRDKIEGVESYLGEDAPPAPPQTEVQKTVTERLLNNPFTRGVQAVFPGKKVGESIGALGAFGIAKARDAITGSNRAENIDLEAPSPLSTTGDAVKMVATPLAIASAPASVGGMAAAGAGYGGVLGAADALQDGGDVSDALEKGVKSAALGGAIGGVAGVAGKAIEAAGKGTYKLAVPMNAREAQIMQTYKAKVPFWQRVKSVLAGADDGPRLAEETAFEKGLVGTEGMMGVQARRASKTLWDDVIGKQLDEAEEVVDMTSFFDDAAKTIVKNNPEPSRQKDLLEALAALKDDYADIPTASLKDLQAFKEGWAQFVPEKAYKGKPIAGSFNDVKNVVSDLARKRIYKALGPEVKQAYIDYGNLKAIAEMGQKAMTGGKLRGGTGGFLSAIKDMVVTPIATMGGYTVYGVGKGIELIGPTGARFVGEIIPDPTSE